MKRSLLTLLIALFVVGSAGAQSAEGEFVPWVEPGSRFGAFVPADWQVQGTAHDLIGGAVLPQMIAVAPDQSQVVTLGADQVFLFVEPAPEAGIVEGDTLPLGQWSVPVLTRYAPGDFLREYLQMWLVEGGTCSALELSPVAGAAQQQAGYAGDEVELSCVYDGGQASGRFYAGIAVFEDPSVGRLWLVSDLYGYLADPGHEAQAAQVLATMVQSLEFAPQAASDGMGDVSGGEMDALIAQQLNGQINQMTSSYMINSMTNQMNWFQQNQDMIMGIRTEYDTQYQYQWVWEQNP